MMMLITLLSDICCHDDDDTATITIIYVMCLLSNIFGNASTCDISVPL